MDALNRLTSWVKAHFVVVIIVIASLMRLVGLDKVPPSLNWDEVSMGYSAYSLSLTGRDEWGETAPLFFRSYGEWKSPVYIYTLVPFIKVFGLNAWGVRLPAALAGILGVYLTYLLGKRLYNERVGSMASLLLAVSPWHVMLSRPAFEAGLALTFIILGIYLFITASDTRRWSYLLWSAFFFGLAPYTYSSAKIVVPILVFTLIFFKRREMGIRRILGCLAILAVLAVPMVRDVVSGNGRARFRQVGVTTDEQLRTEFITYRHTFPLNATLNKIIFNKYTFFGVKAFSNLTSYLSPHFLLGPDSIRAQHSIPFRGVMHFAEFGLLITGVLLLGRQSGIKKALPIIMIITGFIPAAITKDSYHALRSILTLPAWQLVAGLALGMSGQSKKRYIRGLSWLLLIEVVCFIFIYFAWYPRAFARDWQYGYKEAVEYTSAHENEFSKIAFTKAYGEPQLFVAFYSRMDPTIYQQASLDWLEYETRGLPWLDQLESYELGKYTFRSMDWSQDNQDRGTLFVGKDGDFYPDTPIAKSIALPDGAVIFDITTGQ